MVNCYYGNCYYLFLWVRLILLCWYTGLVSIHLPCTLSTFSDHSHTVNKPPDLVPKESPDGCSSYQPKRVAQRAPTNVASMATSTELPLLAQDDVIPIALPTDTPTAQSTTPPNVQATDSATPPTAPPTVPPPTLPPAKHPSGEVTLKESIALVTAHQSLKEQPEEYLPPGGMIDKKILKKFFFGYSVSV